MASKNLIVFSIAILTVRVSKRDVRQSYNFVTLLLDEFAR